MPVWEAVFIMLKGRHFKKRWVKVVFGCVFAFLAFVSSVAPMNASPVYAEPEGGSRGVSCETSLGALGWLVCPATGKISEAVDWLYKRINSVLVINPVEAKDGSPIFEIWKYMRSVTNIAFVVFLLIIVYSQLTGMGITNYGVKKALPKLIVAAILVNLSFYACSLLVDVSNIVGEGLRGVFDSIAASTTGTMNMAHTVSASDMFAALSGGGAIAVGAGAVAFETGAIWMLIPTVLGAVVAVAIGLITIALRQAVVVLLIMIAPLAIVSNILPNTEQWFKKWWQLFLRMIIFYPAFSLLFGASSVAGWAIIVSATDGFGVILGVAVQIFPLFFSWSLMKMSGTFLSTINSRLSTLAMAPILKNAIWADSRRQLTNARHMSRGDAYTPSLRLRQFVSDRKIAREEEIKEHSMTIQNRGAAYAAMRNYDKHGRPKHEAEGAYEAQARNMRYQQQILRHKNNMNMGLGQLASVKRAEGESDKQTKEMSAMRARIQQLDIQNMNAADTLKMETARGEKIDYKNARGFYNRMEDAVNAHMDVEKSKKVVNGELVENISYKRHFDEGSQELKTAEARYKNALDVMEGDALDVQYAAATSAHGYDTQSKIIMNKMQKYFELVPPTKDNVYRMREFSEAMKLDPRLKATDQIDMIIPGLRVLSQRGDTDLVKDIMDDLLKEGVTLGSHASQSLASFLMFEVKDADPYLRRFGKYINLETARAFNDNERKVMQITYDEYVKGYHDGELDLVTENNKTGRMFAKKGMKELMAGTSLDGIERTAMASFDKSLRDVYTENGQLNLEQYIAKKNEIDKEMLPAFISANMKFLSGSEQINSTVAAKTGFNNLQDKATGQFVMTPVWEYEQKKFDSAFGSINNTDEGKKKLRDTYRRATLDYIDAMTPTQILGLRSDFYVPLIEHFSDAYLLNEEGETDATKAEQREKALAAIAQEFGGLDSREAKAAVFNLKKHDAGEEFRERLFKKGKLDQIEKSKRSGAANNAKDWVRELLLLDSEAGLKKWINERRNQNSGAKKDVIRDVKNADDKNGAHIDNGATNDVRRAVEKNTQMSDEEKERIRAQLIERMAEAKKRAEEKKILEEQEEARRRLEEQEKKMREADVRLENETTGSTYTAEDTAIFSNYVENLWYEVRDESTSEDEYQKFFDKSYEYVSEQLGDNSYIAVMYKKYYEEHPDGDSYDMRVFLTELLDDLNNY